MVRWFEPRVATDIFHLDEEIFAGLLVNDVLQRPLRTDVEEFKVYDLNYFQIVYYVSEKAQFQHLCLAVHAVHCRYILNV